MSKVLSVAIISVSPSLYLSVSLFVFSLFVLSLSLSIRSWGAYGLSKAANVLFTQELQRRLEEVCVCVGI